jgi:hypothetical protein
MRLQTKQTAVPFGSGYKVSQWRAGDGGRSRIRTYDPLIKSQLLYQLSYAPIAEKARKTATETGDSCQEGGVIETWAGCGNTGTFRGLKVANPATRGHLHVAMHPDVHQQPGAEHEV